MLPINLILELLLADKTRTSPDSKVSFPWIKETESFPWTGNCFTISVVTAIPTVVLRWENEIVWVIRSFYDCKSNYSRKGKGREQDVFS